ncbi:hypothetical protein K501DRAFT_239181 [Backusella circina FSU 941]|nr:hypothetical protein K501DRAFT_239181 [Backusella circina FSU 941]
MDIHNIEDYLDLQDQHEMNLLAAEDHGTEQKQEDSHAEWHSETAPLIIQDNVLDNNPFMYTDANWSLLQSNVQLEGINLTQLINQTANGINSISDTNGDKNTTFITPDSLLKNTPLEEKEPEQRITRSRAKGVTPHTSTAETKKRATRQKKLYCTCQQPYNGKPMVQCDQCQEWFHCTCVEFDPDTTDDVDWSCQSCKGKQANQEEEEQIESKVSKTPSPEPVKTSTRTTRSSKQSTCLYSGCKNRTRADSYCSDVCARKSNEKKAPESDSKTKKTKSKKEESDDDEYTEEEVKVSDINNDEEIDDKQKKEEDVFVYPPVQQKKRTRRPSRLQTFSKRSTRLADKPKEEQTETEEEALSKSPSTEPDTPSSDNTPMSPSQMSEQINPVRRNVIKNLSQILKTILESVTEKAPDMLDDDKDITVQERAEQLARAIENTMFDQLGDEKEGQKQRTCGEPYKSKFRSLLYNLKDKANETFQLRVVTHDLEPMELIKMSSEDMANPELKSMDEVLRKKGLKESVLKLVNTPIIKKTHKGDIIMIPSKDDTSSSYTEQQTNQETPILTPASEPSIQPETTPFQPAVPTGPDAKMDPLDDILARISVPNPAEDNKRYASSNLEDEAVKKRKITQDVEDLLGEEEDTPFKVDEVDEADILNGENNNTDEVAAQQQEQEGQEKSTPMEIDMPKLPTIWEGRINMPQVADFEASARQIGGRMLDKEEWQDVLSPTMWIEGRIPTERVTSYVTQSQYSTSREIVLLEIEAGSNRSGDTPEIRELNDRQAHVLLEYLESRKRYAVVGHNKTKIKDFYLVPLYKHQHIPDCLYVVRVEETVRECDLFLGVLVLSKNTPSLHHQAYLPPHPSY